MNTSQVSKAQIKYIQSLKLRKYRQRYGCFIAEGRKVVGELIRDNLLKIRSLYALDSWFQEYDDLLFKLDIPKYMVDVLMLKHLSGLSTPDQVLGVFEIPVGHTPVAHKAWILYLDGIADPGNLGTIIRSADWFGVEYIFLSPGSVDGYNAKCIQASMGSIGRVKLLYQDFLSVVQQYPEAAIFIADARGIPVYDLPMLNQGILVIGSESHGTSDLILSHQHTKVSVPKNLHSRAESLNAAMAATALMTIMLRSKSLC